MQPSVVVDAIDERRKQCHDIFHFELSKDEMGMIDPLDQDKALMKRLSFRN